MKRYRSVFLLILIVLTFILISCNKDSKNKVEKIEIKNLPDNIILQLKDGKVKYNTFKNRHIENIDLNLEEEIRYFNKEKEFLIYSKIENFQTKLRIIRGDNALNYEVNGVVEKVWVNNSCDKILYKVNNNDEIIDYYILDLNTKENKKLKDNIVISGDIVSFLRDDTLVLYGVNSDKKISGIYTYDLKTEKYSLTEQISKAFVDYIKVLQNNKILFGKSFFDNKKESYLYNFSDNSLELISTNIKNMKSLVIIDDKIYFIGIAKDSNKYSLYSLDIKNKNLKRLVFDFPSNVDENSNLVYINGEIIFVGYSNSENEGNIYSYNIENKSIKVISHITSKYIII